MSQKISRRSFLKGSLAAAGALGVSTLPIPPAAHGARKGELATLIDIRKCIGCGACVEACRESNQSKFPEPRKPFPKMYPATAKVSDWSEKRDVEDRLTPYNWVFIQESEVTVNGKKETFTFPRRCMHCQNPPCANLCPWGAASTLQNGITLIDPDACLGGAKCHDVCPWHIPQRQTGVGLYLDILPSLAGNGVMYKCDRCHDRVREGKLPVCIEACPEEVQKIGPRDEIVREAHALAKEIGGTIYGEKENGGTNTLYVSPVPFDQLNRGIHTGPGKPHLGEVADSMGQAENLTKAMIIAPIAGIAAAVGKAYGLGRRLSAGRSRTIDENKQEEEHSNG
ncbi:MAG: 4Fe-4S dicluster domain-containing protein [Deltaproteobacteria bacterium]|nr:4Fe-4S dicluster domain-containing protein [Deltaproteobacteria bacterium]